MEPPTRTPAAPKSRRGNEGMTLLEVVASIAILMSAVLSLTAVASTTHRLRRKVLEKNIVLEVIERQKSEIEVTPFDELVATHDGRGFDVRLEDGENAMFSAWPDDEDEQPGEVSTTILRTEGGQPSLVEVRIEVAWTGVAGPQSIQDSLRISRMGSN